MMEPHEESLEQVEIDSVSSDIDSKPSYVELSSECGDIATTSAPVVANVEEDVIGAVVSSTRPYMWKFIIPLALIAAVSGTIATVSRYEATAKERELVNENQQLMPSIDTDNLLYVAPETTKKSRATSNVTALRVSKDGSRTKGSKASPTEGGGSTGAGSMSFNMMFGIDDANALVEAEASSTQPQFIVTAKAEKASKGSKAAVGNTGGEATGGGVKGGSMSMDMNMMFGIDDANALGGTEASSTQPQFIITAKAEKASKGSKAAVGNTGGEATGGGVKGGSMSMEITVDIEQHEFDVNAVATTNLQTNAFNANIDSSRQGVQKASKGSKTTTLNTSKAPKETVTATTTIPGVEAGEGSMSTDSSERALETFGIAPGYEEIQNGPVFYRRKYIDNHLL